MFFLFFFFFRSDNHFDTNETKFSCSRDVLQRFLCFMSALHGTLHFVIRSLICTREIISDRSKAKIVVSGVDIFLELQFRRLILMKARSRERSITRKLVESYNSRSFCLESLRKLKNFEADRIFDSLFHKGIPSWCLTFSNGNF